MILCGRSELTAFPKEEQIKFGKQKKPKEFYYHPRSIQEALLFGHWNVLRLPDKKLCFRPNQFSLAIDGDNCIDVAFKHSIFKGFYTENFFSTSYGDIILYGLKELSLSLIHI